MRLNDRNERIILWSVIGVWVIILSYLFYLKFLSLQIKHADHWHFYYLAKNLFTNGSWFDLTRDYGHRFGTHFSVTLGIPAIFLSFFDSPLTLAFVQVFGVSLGALAAFLIGKHFFPEPENRIYPLILSFSYLGFVPLLKTTLYDFDVVRMAPTLILFFLYFAVLKKKDLKALPFLLLLFLTRETLPLIVAGTGLYFIFFEKDYRRGFLYFFAGILFFFALNFFLMPYFRQAYPSYLFPKEGLAYLKERYGYLPGNTLTEFILNALKNPLVVLKVFFLEPWFKWITLLGCSAFLLFFPFFRLKYLMSSLLVLILYYLSPVDFSFTYKHQYLSEIYPPMFLSFAAGLRFLLDQKRENKWLLFITFHLRKILIFFFLAMFISQVGNWAFKTFPLYQKHKAVIEKILEDPLDLKNQKDSAFFLHNRLFPYFGWRKYTTILNWYSFAFPIYQQQQPNLDAYAITLNHDDFGESQSNQNLIKKMQEDGFKKIYQFQYFEIYFREGKNENHRKNTQK